MFLSPTISNPQEYLEEALVFLKKYRWIYTTKNTRILCDRVLDNIPNEWIDHFTTINHQNILDILSRGTNELLPESLRMFFDDLHQLKLNSEEFNKIEPPVFRYIGISDKKMHEIFLLAPVVDELCKKANYDLVVDIGSGLGYLSHLLYQNFGHQVLGLEVCKKFIDQAYKTQENLYPSCKNNVIFSELFVQIDSEKTIESLIEKHFGKNRRICLTGLHACADLSVTVLKLFSKMECVKALSIMPCCYHRIEIKEEMAGKTCFNNFPCSRTLKDIFERFETETYLGVPFLRLACQDTLESFLELSEKDLEIKTQELLFRAVLEFVAENQNCTVKRLKRKSGKLTTTDGELFFETHLNNLPSCHRLLAAPSSTPRDIDEPFLMEMRRKWEEYHTNIKRRSAVAVFIALQALIQSVCENVVLVDRIEMVREYGYSCNLKRVTDSKLSPRCWALVGVKDIL